MSEPTDMLSAGLEQLEADIPVTITWQGAAYPVVPTSAVRGKDLGAGGFKLRSDFSFVARPESFTEGLPQLKQRISYLGDEYRIDSIEKTPGEAFLRFECNDPNQGV